MNFTFFVRTCLTCVDNELCRQEHPEALEDIGGSSSGTYMSRQFGVAVPPKTITTMQTYINEKCEEEQKKGSKVGAVVVNNNNDNSNKCSNYNNNDYIYLALQLDSTRIQVAALGHTATPF